MPITVPYEDKTSLISVNIFTIISLFQSNRTCPICRGDAASFFNGMASGGHAGSGSNPNSVANNNPASASVSNWRLIPDLIWFSLTKNHEEWTAKQCPSHSITSPYNFHLPLHKGPLVLILCPSCTAMQLVLVKGRRYQLFSSVSAVACPNSLM